MRKGLAALAIPLLLSASATARAGDGPVYGSMKRADTGQGASLNGAQPFPADNAWNTDISTRPVDPRSNALISTMGPAVGLHPDFGSGKYAGAIIGIPYVVVGRGQKDVPIRFRAYGSESDKGPYPIPKNADIEGDKPKGGSIGGDRHLIVVDKSADRLYELFRAFPRKGGGWNADSGAIFHLDSNDVRPTAKPGWTSADAAGLPIFPGLARFDEVSAGEIRHALRFTVAHSRRAYVPPASHWQSSDPDPDLPPMGMRVRLKASYVIPDSFSSQTKTILRALKTYGMIVADEGAAWSISGAPDEGWKNIRLVPELREVTGRNFEVVRMDGLVTR